MVKNRFLAISFSLTIFALGFWIGRAGNTDLRTSANTTTKGRVFEIRTYTAAEDKLDALLARFRNHTVKLFEKHGMESIGYWVPQDAPLSKNTLIYILAHPDREAANKNWGMFRNDPEWKRAKEESEAKGGLVSKVESVYMEATDYSRIK